MHRCTREERHAWKSRAFVLKSDDETKRIVGWRHQVETRVRRAIVNGSAWRNSNRMKQLRGVAPTSIINTRRQTIIDSSPPIFFLLPSISPSPSVIPFLSFSRPVFVVFSLFISLSPPLSLSLFTRDLSFLDKQRFHSQELRAIKRTCLFMTAPIYLRYEPRPMIIGNGQKLAKLPDQTSSELFRVCTRMCALVGIAYRSRIDSLDPRSSEVLFVEEHRVISLDFLCRYFPYFFLFSFFIDRRNMYFRIGNAVRK